MIKPPSSPAPGGKWRGLCTPARRAARGQSRWWQMPSRFTWVIQSKRTAAGVSSPLSPQNPVGPSSGLRTLCEFLAESPQSPVRRYTPRGADIDSVIDVRAVFQQGHLELAIEAMPFFLLPRKGRYGLRDYEKMFCPDLKSRHDIFNMRSIDRNRGCMVVVRPDRYVAHVLPLDAYAELAAFFDGFRV